MLFAQDAGTPASITGALIFLAVTMAGLIGWIIKSVFDRTIPDLSTGYRASLEAALGEFAKLRDQFDARQAALLAHCEAETDKEREGSERRYQGALAEMRQLHQSLTDQGQILRSLLSITQTRTRQADLIESAEEAIWSKTLDGIITSWNPAAERLLGWRRTEVVGQSVYKLVPGDLHGQEKDTLERVAKGEAVSQYRTARMHRNGQRVELNVTVSPVADPAGKVVGVSSIAREV